MTRSLKAITAEPWAIEPSWLHVLAALARRDLDAEALKRLEGWDRMNLDAVVANVVVGAASAPPAKLPGARYASIADGVAIIPVMGPIFPRANMMTEMSGATSVSMLQNDLRLALDNPDVGSIMLLIDSPGGAVAGINAMADAVYAANKRKEVIAHVPGAAASAAYWIASSAKQIMLDKTGQVGSIGVVAALTKQIQPDTMGEMTFEIVSSNAPNKRPDPATEDGQSQIVGMLDDLEALFIADVARGRGVTTDKVISDFGQGGMKVGKGAVSAGMADKVQSQDATFAMARRSAANYRKLQSMKQDQ